MKDGKAATLYGTATIRKRPTPMELEPTASASLDPFAHSSGNASPRSRRATRRSRWD